MLTIVDALRDPNLFGGHPAFGDLSTWRSWLVFLKALYGLPFEGDDIEIFRRHTGRSLHFPYTQPSEGYREAVCVVGRQSGKTRVAALIASFEAALSEPEADRTAIYALLVAQDHRAALRALFGYVVSFFEQVPLLQRSIRERRSETLVLENGVSLSAYPCRPPAVRGLRARVAVCDELAYFLSTDYRPQDTEMVRALRPTLATTGGRLIVLSSPYGQSGQLWDLHRRHHGRDESDVLVWQASAPEMNPTLPEDYLERMRQEDPEAYRSEVLGEFRAGIQTLFEYESVDACVVHGRRELAPVPGVRYQAFVDPSGGSRDRFGLAVGHRDGGRCVVDCVRAWSPPFNPSGVVAEAAAVLRHYRTFQTTGDRYAGEWPREAFRSHGVHYTVSERTKSELYVELLPVVNSGRIELPDSKELLRELRGLERHRGSAGRDRVDHRAGSHDDLANVVAGVSWLLVGRKRVEPGCWVPGGPEPDEDFAHYAKRRLGL